MVPCVLLSMVCCLYNGQCSVRFASFGHYLRLQAKNNSVYLPFYRCRNRHDSCHASSENRIQKQSASRQYRIFCIRNSFSCIVFHLHRHETNGCRTDTANRGTAKNQLFCRRQIVFYQPCYDCHHHRNGSLRHILYGIYNH